MFKHYVTTMPSSNSSQSMAPWLAATMQNYTHPQSVWMRNAVNTTRKVGQPYIYFFSHFCCCHINCMTSKDKAPLLIFGKRWAGEMALRWRRAPVTLPEDLEESPTAICYLEYLGIPSHIFSSMGTSTHTIHIHKLKHTYVHT